MTKKKQLVIYRVINTYDKIVQESQQYYFPQINLLNGQNRLKNEHFFFIWMVMTTILAFGHNVG